MLSKNSGAAPKPCKIYALLIQFSNSQMNPLVKLLPLLTKSRVLGKYKIWVSLLVILLTAYQLFSTTGIGSDWGIPSYDTFYKEPRDVLITRVENASKAQQEVAEEFKTALEKFKSVTGFDGGDLEKKFNTLNAAFKKSESVAEDVSKRVDAVVNASNRLLEEWREELNDYHDQTLKRKAEAQFDATRVQAEKLIATMRNAEAKIEPVLGAFRDQVLFLKHNLNMQAISSLQQETAIVEADVAALIREMEASIAEAELFVRELTE